jgi:outer membrane protein assembly factor BamB
MRDGRVFATRAGNSNASYLYALDATTGATLWKSQDLTDIYVSEGPAFAPNGDLLIGNATNVTRVNAVTGARVYQAARSGNMSGGREPVVVGNKYYIRGGAVGERVAAYDLATGQFLYWSAAIGSAQSGLFAGKDGTIYAPAGSLYAFTDTGSALVQKWASAPLPNCPFSTFAVGPDGSVYSYKPVGGSVVLVRLSAQTGAEITRSQAILSGTSIIPGHMAVDRSGILFVTNGAYELYSFNPDLSRRWSVTLPRSEGGPALAADGALLVGGNDGVHAFASDPAAVPDGEIASGAGAGAAFSLCYPNPFRGEASIRFNLPTAGTVSLAVYDPLGREVRRVAGGTLDAGSHELRLDGSGLSGGVYFYRLRAGDRVDTRRILLLE